MRAFRISAYMSMVLAALAAGPVHSQCPLPPPIEIDDFPSSSAVIDLMGPNGTERIVLQGPSTVHVAIGPNGEAADTDGDHLDQVKTQMVKLSLSGSSSLGAVTVEIRDVSKDPFKCSAGEIEETQNTMSGRLDLPPFAPSGTANSFFDLFFEITISTPSGPVVLHTRDPKHMNALIDHKPPNTGKGYENPQDILLYDENNQLSGYKISAGRHVPKPEPDPPTCDVILVAGGVDAILRDAGTGLASVMVNRQENATLNIPGFPIGSPGPVTVQARKIDPALRSRVELKVTDVSGNSILCDPVLTLQIREAGKPVSERVTDLPQAEGKVTVFNGSPGVTTLKIEVNGRRFLLTGLRDGEQRSLDVSSALRPGNGNTATLTAEGKPGGDIEIVIHD